MGQARLRGDPDLPAALRTRVMSAPDDPKDHRDLMLEAMELEADGQQRLLAGETSAGRRSMSEAAALYLSLIHISEPTRPY